MTGQIFTNYRREDSSAWARCLYDRLHDRFPQNEIFMDVEQAPGIDFIEAIKKKVGSCDVLIAVIGRQWLRAVDEQGRRRLDNPKDFVRLEIATALKRGIRVIPVLVDGASMPKRSELPKCFKPLADRNALVVRHERFQDDIGRLIGDVEQVLFQRKCEEQERIDTERCEREKLDRLRADRLADAEQCLLVKDDTKELLRLQKAAAKSYTEAKRLLSEIPPE